MTTRYSSLACTLWVLLCLAACCQAQGPKTFDVTQAPYSADPTGTVDDTAAIQRAVNDAIAYGNANGHPAVTVLLPAGTYLVAGGPSTQITITGSTNLTFEGAGTASTMVWYTRAGLGRCFAIYGNTNVTIQDFSADVQKLPATGQYDLGETQGTITAVSRTPGSSTVTLTVQVEQGYPLLSRPDIQAAPSNGYGQVLYLLTDPTRQNFDSPSLTGVTPTGSGATGTLTLNTGNNDLYVGEQWTIYTNPGALWMNMGYGNSGTTTLQNLNYYGGAVGWMGNALPQRHGHLQQPLLRPAALPVRPAPDVPGGVADGQPRCHHHHQLHVPTHLGR